MTFGKPGRPAEDRLLRQRGIFEAVSPLILSKGVRQLSMREAAYAACLSVGGLYHYFPTKRDLVLHGLDREARDRICLEQREQLAGASEVGIRTFIDVCVDTSLRIIAFMRPSVIAAQELSGGTLQDALDPDWTSDVSDLVAGFRASLPTASLVDLTSLARLIRMVMIGALIEREVDLNVVRADLYALIGAQLDQLIGANAA